MAFRFEDVKCAHCGRMFLPAPYHHWRHGHKLFCCYTCMKDYERANKEYLKNKRSQRAKKAEIDGAENKEA